MSNSNKTKFVIEPGLSREEVRQKVLEFCTRGADGVIYRCVIEKIDCRQCGKPRFNDGTRCWGCASYQNHNIGKPKEPEQWGSAASIYLDRDFRGKVR